MTKFNVMISFLKKYTDALRKRIDPWLLSVKPLRRPFYEKRLKASLRRWLLYHQKEIVFNKVTWMGTPIWKNVLDAWIYQEIIYEVQPDVIVEIGSKFGGSTKYFANLLDLIGKGYVISVDKDRSQYSLTHPRVKTFTGSSTDPEILAGIKELCQNKKTMVIHDADHRFPQAYRDMNAYAPLVSLGSYFIIEDGIVDLYHPGDGLGFKNPGPLAAVEAFLQKNPNFVTDLSRERYVLTYNPNGFLKRIA